jgi:hypothetical protein
MVHPLQIDPGLKEYGTDRQREVLEAIERLGGASAAARELGVNKSYVARQVKAVEVKAARLGYAPGHFQHGVAPGYLMGKVTVQRGPAGVVERTWERQSPEAEDLAAKLRAAAAAMAEELPRVEPLAAPTQTLERLANLYVITDFHFGAMAWGKEGGADWDLKIAERTLMGVFERLLAQSPAARVGVLAQLGDLLHADGLIPVTPTHGHVLDADGRFSKVVQVAIKCLRRVVDMMLMKHHEVHIIMAEGNHDLASSVWLRVMFAALYENEPRVTVNNSELPYYIYQHGKTMLGFHHGHLKKKESLPLLFAAQFSEVWGATTYRVVHTGHQHHEDLKEHAGIRVHQHPTLAARDAHSSRCGWISERQAPCLTYDDRGRKVGEVIVTPEMLDDAA